MLFEITPIEHFSELVKRAIRHQKVNTNELAEYYLSSLLTEFMDPEKMPDEPVTTSFIKALGSTKEVQVTLLRQLGDFSLFISGFFSDSLKRKLVDMDYYILIGVASYGYLAGIHSRRKFDKTLSSLFSELSEKFKLFVDVVSEVSERSRLTSSEDILRIYERWLRTGSKRTEAILRELGIEPLPVSSLPVQ